MVLLLLLLLPSAVTIAFSDVVIDAMIAAGQPRGMTGRLQSMYAATIVTSVAGGALSQWGMQQVWFLVRERRRPADACAEASSVRIPPSRTIAEMWRTFREPGIVAIGAFLFLWSFNPFSSTVL